MLPAQDLKLAEILLADRAVSEEQYKQLKLESINKGKTIDQLVEEHSFVSQEAVAKAKAKLFNIPFVKLKEIGFDPAALILVPRSVAARYTIFPFAFDKTKTNLLTAMTDPLDLPAIDFIRRKTGRQIIPYFAAKKDITEAIGQKYTQRGTEYLILAQ